MMNILVAVDFSDITSRVIEHAENLAKTFSGKVWLVHAVPPDPDFVGFEVGPQTVRDAVAKQMHEEHRRLHDMATDIKSRGIDVTPLLVQGPTVEMILQEAANTNADMIVMGSHGHGALYTTLLGSVSEGVLRKAPCPLYIIPFRTD